MKKKGQALVEFVIILPVFIMLVLGVIDIGKILYSKIILEEQISYVISLYQGGKKEEEIVDKLDFEDDVFLKIENDNEYINFNLTKEIDIITPGLNFIFSNPYQLKVSRSIDNNA